MEKIPYFQVDAFASQPCTGNPAGVCLLDSWPDDTVLQSIAFENNLSETAFLVTKDDRFELRWFTPVVEVGLCGHATLASAHVIFTDLQPARRRVEFLTRSGVLTVEKTPEYLLMDFPSKRPVRCDPPQGLTEILGAAPSEVLRSRDLVAVFNEESVVRDMEPDFQELARLDCFAVIVTAPGGNCDFVSRFFAPRAGIAEDPVTGSAHSSLIPYWSERLGKQRLFARQLSKRGGELFCADKGHRVEIGGKAVIYMRGAIEL